MSEWQISPLNPQSLELDHQVANNQQLSQEPEAIPVIATVAIEPSTA